jgi:SAM-dependent methyltransferase
MEPSDTKPFDWAVLARLRRIFLEAGAGTPDYWKNESELENYDRTFGQRIGWKWDYVLAELKRRGWRPPGGEVLDWGCGSGMAGRAFLDFFGAGSVSRLRLWDRSKLAMDYARRRALAKYPGLEVLTGMDAGSPPNLLLVSHVVTEMFQEQVEQLVRLAGSVQSVIWVEPGTYEASWTLIGIRERLRGAFNVCAPCTHQGACGLMAKGNERHWCHHFAPSPPEIYMDGDWSRFGREMGVDLRRLPLSFLVLDRRPQPEWPPGTVRVIGLPRIYKPYALLLGCDLEGVRECKLARRTHPEEYKRLKKELPPPLQIWRRHGAEIVEMAEAPGFGAGDDGGGG